MDFGETGCCGCGGKNGFVVHEKASLTGGGMRLILKQIDRTLLVEANMSALTARNEDYLKTIYKLETENKVVRVKDLATGLGVRSPTVVGSIAPLKDAGLVRQEHYGYISLTEKGRELAESLVERERLLKTFFVKILGLDENEAGINACSIEHYITPLCRKRLVSFIRFLDQCSDGTPKWLEHFRYFLRTGEKPRCDRCGETTGGPAQQ
jgi:DtxR family Mn-dependent transcriptional regulator